MVAMAAMSFVRPILFATLTGAFVTLSAQNVPLSRQTGTGAISGVVIDGDTKRPVAGAEVYLGMANYGPVGTQSRQLTDAKGRFVYGNLPAADIYFMNVKKAGYINGHYGDRAPSASNLSNGRIALVDGQWFDHATIMIWRPGAIAGTVTDERGEPVVGAYVGVLQRIAVAGATHLAAGPLTTTDDRGRYRLPGLTPGSYLIHVPSVQTAVPASTPAMTVEGLTPGATGRDEEPPRRNNGALALDGTNLLVIGNYPTPPSTAGAPQAYPMMFYPGTSLVANAMAVDITGGDTREGIDVTIRPVPTARVSGRVVGDVAAASGMVLRLVGPGLDDLATGSEAATTLVRADGQFTFLNVPAGDYTLVGSRASLHLSVERSSSTEMPRTPGELPGPGSFLGGIPGGPPGTRVSGSHAAGDVNVWARQPVSVGAGDITDLALPLRRASSMRGHIAWEGAGVPPGPTAILLEPADGNTWLGMPQSAARASFDDDDHFIINGILPGAYVLRAAGLGPPYTLKSVTIGGRDYFARPIDTTTGQDFGEVVVTYTDRIASIGGAVEISPDGPSMLSVLAFPTDRTAWTGYGFSAHRFKTTGVANDGQFLIDNIPAGSYFLIAVDAADAARWQDPAFLTEAAKVAASVTVGWGEKQSRDLKVSVIK
jgi:hypothetical protein